MDLMEGEKEDIIPSDIKADNPIKSLSAQGRSYVGGEWDFPL